MQIKFKRSISEYKYLIMFDLASRVTGVCIWDLKENKPIDTKVIKVGGKEELAARELWDQIDVFFNTIKKELGVELSECLVAKEMMPSQAGRFTTIQTFTALSRSHATLDLYCSLHELSVYDYVGVAPISTHCYFKKLMEWENKHAVEKEDIRAYVCSIYNINIDKLSLDESDAVFLAKTLIESKWDKDIDDEKRAVKRHAKTLKAAHAINACNEEIERLDGLKTRKTL